jgi:hypothetical protein
VAHDPVEWRGRFNAVHVRVRQRCGLVPGWVDIRAVGVTLRVEGKQFTDLSRSPTPTQRVRKLGLEGLKARWERDGVLVENHDASNLRDPPGVLTLRRPGRPDVTLPGLDAGDADLDALCAALTRAAEAAAELVGHGRAEVPRELRGLLGELED